MLEKDKYQEYNKVRQVKLMECGIHTMDVGLIAAKTSIFGNHTWSFDYDKACAYLSAYTSARHAEAQIIYGNRHGMGNQRQNVSATPSGTGDRGGRGRGGRSGQRGGRSAGRGQGNGCTKLYINDVDVTDHHRNFTAAEWEKLGTMRSFVLQMREGGGHGGCGSNDNWSSTSTTNCTTSAVSATDNDDNINQSNDASVVSEITERGSQNWRSFGRVAYNNN